MNPKSLREKNDRLKAENKKLLGKVRRLWQELKDYENAHCKRYDELEKENAKFKAQHQGGVMMKICVICGNDIKSPYFERITAHGYKKYGSKSIYTHMDCLNRAIDKEVKRLLRRTP